MAKIQKIEPKPVSAEYTLTLTQKEAEDLRDVLGSLCEQDSRNTYHVFWVLDEVIIQGAKVASYPS